MTTNKTETQTFDASKHALDEATRATVRTGDRIKGRDGKWYTVYSIESRSGGIAITGERQGTHAGRKSRCLHSF